MIMIDNIDYINEDHKFENLYETQLSDMYRHVYFV